MDEFTCNNKKCVPTEWICDKSDDCGDNSDESPSLCNPSKVSIEQSPVSCPPDHFQCKNGPCIDYSLVCNGEANCYDGSDEEGVCNTSCNALNNPCAQICQKTPVGPLCKCKSGYRLLGDGKKCQDVDECLEKEPRVCSQICRNEPGSYLCDCYQGFILRNDKVSCKAEGEALSLIFTSDNHQIREMSQMENTLNLLFEEEIPKITGLDVDSRGFVYFSVSDAETLHRMNKSSGERSYIEQVGQVQNLGVDWITGNVYVVNNDVHSKAITVCNFHDKLCARLIPIDLHRQVSALVVDAVNRVIFYSITSWWMFNSPSYVVYKSNLDGT